MPNFGVRCFDSAIWDRVEHDPIEAESALDAAMRVCGERLVPDGKLGQLRAEVWPTSDPSAKETFYMPPIDRNSN